MTSFFKNLCRFGVVRQSSKQQKQAQVNHMIKRWVTEEERLQKPRLRGAAVKRSIFGDSGYILLIIPAATFCLGTWQVKRRKWKLDLINQLEVRTTADPFEIPLDISELQTKEMQYRRVKVRGRFDHSKELYIAPRSNVRADASQGIISYSNRSGNYVITPLKLADRDLTIMVNRGWIPHDKKDPATRMEGQTEEEVEIVGIIRHTEKRAPMTPRDKPGSRSLLRRNVEKMAEMVDADPLMIDADFDSTVPGGPIGGQTRVTLRNEHLSYIITWYSLCAITLVMWYKRYRQPPPPDTMMTYMRKMQKRS